MPTTLLPCRPGSLPAGTGERSALHLGGITPPRRTPGSGASPPKQRPPQTSTSGQVQKYPEVPRAGPDLRLSPGVSLRAPTVNTVGRSKMFSLKQVGQALSCRCWGRVQSRVTAATDTPRSACSLRERAESSRSSSAFARRGVFAVCGGWRGRPGPAGCLRVRPAVGVSCGCCCRGN